jgi:hypothetical protein
MAQMKWLVIVIPLLVVLSPLGYYGRRWYIVSTANEAFAGAIDRYKAGCPEAPDVNTNAYLKGKIVVVDVAAGKVDPLMAKIPSDLRAGSPEEAQTAVMIRWDRRLVGAYTDGENRPSANKAWVFVGGVEIVDLGRKVKVARREIEGGQPPRWSNRIFDEEGSWPDENVLEYLMSLPRR